MVSVPSQAPWPAAPGASPVRSAGTPVLLPPMAFGGDYNAEQWPETVHADDVERMAEAGVTAVTVGVFAWPMIEPSPGVFEFTWLDTLMDRLHNAGIKVILATPTASPPTWFSATHPESLPVTDQGVRLGYGARESFCPSSPAYRAASARVAQAMADRYSDHPALALWHIGNEYGAHVGACYCTTSDLAFRNWLRLRYEDLDNLNEAWGTSFWGQTYIDFEHITVPRQAPMPVNPAQQLDFRRFTVDEFIQCYRDERDAIRQHCTEVPITTNFMTSTCTNLDYWRWAGEVDVVANNHYLTAADPQSYLGLSLSADLSRGLAGEGSWLLMEHSTSAVNWQPRNTAKRPGEMTRNTLAHIARGADSALFFQWRASRYGGEKFHSAMLPHAGPNSRVWHEVRELGAKLAALGEVTGTSVQTDVAVIWDYECEWALDLEYRPSVDVRARDAHDRWYAALWRAKRTVRYLPPGPIPPEMPVVFVPSLYLCSTETAKALHEYVTGGGTVVVGFFSGIVDEHDAIHPGPFGVALADTLGLQIEEFHPLLEAEQIGLHPIQPSGGAAELTASVWSEHVVCTSAEPQWLFADGPDAGLPALTRHQVGLGSAWYLATRPDPQTLDALVRLVSEDAGLPAAREVPAELEMVRRTGDDRSYLFLINHSPEPVTIDGKGLDLLTGALHDGQVTVPSGGVVVLRETPPRSASRSTPGA